MMSWRTARTLFLKSAFGLRQVFNSERKGFIRRLGVGGTFFLGGYYVANNYHWPLLRVNASEQKVEKKERKKAAVYAQRESRFLTFASVEYEGNVYMTPEDFLDSVTNETARPRIGRLRLTNEEVKRFLNSTPRKSRGTPNMFRNLRNQGLISYTEYLFLICVLTKPQSGFQIAFNMFDTDGNTKVDKEEFLVVQQLMSGNIPSKELIRSVLAKLSDRLLIPDLLRKKLGVEPSYGKFVREEDKAPTVLETQDTTLTTYFFGSRGRDSLTFGDFVKFSNDLQTEVLSIEFFEFAKGKATIGEDDFARILLRYTILNKDEVDVYITRMRSRIPVSKGISFQDFRNFCLFLNSLDDFALAMRLYTLADHPISQEDFKRAVRACTGKNLDPHLINTMFQLFDVDGDDHLSHKEFVSVMRDRLHRGFKYQTPAIGGVGNSWQNFRKCVANELKHDY